MNLLNRIWNMSPASLCRGLQKRWKEKTTGSHWAPIKDGVLRGIELYLPPSGPVWEEMLKGSYDEFLYDALSSRIDLKNATVWDIGAHVGYHSLSFAARGSTVVAFEPNPANLKRMLINFERNATLASRIRHLQAAVSDTEGEMTFFYSDDLRGLSMGGHLERATPPLSAGNYAKFKSARVATVKIDSLVANGGEKRPDILKIDVEGAEELVLRGGFKFFQQHHPILLIEIHHICLMYSVYQLLKSWRYSLKILDREHASPSRCFVIAYLGDE